MPTLPVTVLRRSPLLACLLMVAIVGCETTSSNVAIGRVADAEANVAESGQMVEGPGRIYGWAPEVDESAYDDVDGERILLRRVLEDLGPEAVEWYQHVQTLANPFFEGRLPGSRGHAMAADYIEFYMQETGLEPAFTIEDDFSGTARTYRQPFVFTSRTSERFAVDGENIAGVLRGRGDLADEWVVIAAHYDHVGDGSLGAVRPNNTGQLHPGADDNASGTAGVLVLARMLSEIYDDSDDDLRSILFMTFDGEEFGLHGSRTFVKAPAIPLEQTTLLINLDMIGRLRGDNLCVLGLGTADGLRDLIQPHVERSRLTVSAVMSGSGASDDANFHRMQVAGIHMFTGMTREYTSPADTAATLNPRGAVQVMDLAADIAMDVATRPQKLVYNRPARGPGSDRGYARVRLGIRPGMSDDLETGILVDDVSTDTSADDAGIRGGDILLAWDGKPLDQGMRSLFQNLQKHEPGDIIIMTIKRGDETFDLPVTLKAGQRRPRHRD